MWRSLSRMCKTRNCTLLYIQRQTFLTHDYKCKDAWNSQISSPILNKVNLNDFYNVLDQNYSSKGVISAIDVDIFANAIRDSTYLDELKDLLHKLRLSAETGSTLESIHHATIRNFIEFGHVHELIDILKDPLTFGVFLDHYSANILLDSLITSEDYEKAASVAAIVMLQEDYNNDITCALCQYACYKFLSTTNPPAEEKQETPAKNVKVEEVKIRIKYLRNPYYDDHFDIKDPLLLSGKTLAWMSDRANENTNKNLQIIGWLYYKKFEKLLSCCESLSRTPSSKVFTEIIDILRKHSEVNDGQEKDILERCIALLSKVTPMEGSLVDALKISIENAINKAQANDIAQQEKLFKSWAEIREKKLEEQTKRLDRAKRMQLIQERQDQLKEEEQKLWFFENEEVIDLEIEEKEKLIEEPSGKNVAKADDEYIPPEILPKRK